MPEAEAWQSFAGVGGVIIFLGGLVFALRRLGIIRSPAAAAPSPAPAGNCGSVEQSLTDRVHKLERELDAFKLHVAENYVRRDDYITAESRVIGMLEKHSAMLARLDERIGSKS